MKIRIKFQKTGNLQFIGHLDVMRFFQKCLRRAEIPVCFSGGYSPHPLISFATPLGLGHTSEGEYMDMEIDEISLNDEKLLERMNQFNVPDMKVTQATLLPDDAKNAMSLLAAADYFVSFRDNHEPADIESFWNDFLRFFEQEEIVVTKKTKTSTKTVDLKAQIHELRRENDGVFMKLDTGSASNCKPELLFETYYGSLGKNFDPVSIKVHRIELYGEEEGALKPLYAYGTEF